MRVFPFLLGMVFLPSALFAQTGAGLVSGAIIDSNGVAVVGAKVQLKNAATGSTVSTASFAHGKYTFGNVPPGTYELAVAVPALKPFARNSVTVQAGQTLSIDVHLEDTTQLSTLGEDRFAVAADLKKHAPPAGPTPRIEGKPDLSGVWWTPTMVDAGKPEFLPAAKAITEQRTESLRKDNPQARCLPSAILRLGPVWEFVQGKQMMIEISDDDSPGFHQIYLDGRAHPEDPNPAWYGHNIGRWEGDTLVIDRVGFDARAYLDQDQHPHSNKLHIIERYRRPDLGHLETEITVEDPGVLAKPWTMKRVSELASTEEIYEFICPENNRDVPHLVGK